MANDSPQSRLEQIVAVLQRRRVNFIVIGGQAEYLMGSPRVTFDVDICHERTQENLARLAEALIDMKVRLRDVAPELPFVIDARALTLGNNFTFICEFGDFDCFALVEPIGNYGELLKDAEVFELGDQQIKTISLANLVRVKRHIGRSKDRESLQQLMAIEQIRREKTP